MTSLKPPKNTESWKVVRCNFCKKKLKDAKKPFIKGPDTGSKIYCQECADILFSHYYPPKADLTKRPFNPSRR